MIDKKKIRNTLIISLFLALTLLFTFQSPIKIFVKDLVPEIAYLRLSWIKNILTGNDFGFYKYEIKIGDQFSDMKDYINNQQFEFSIKLNNNKNLNTFQIPPLFPGITIDEVNTAYIDFHKDDLIYATKNGTFFNVKIDKSFMHFRPIKTNISNFLIKRLEEKNASINYFNPYSISKLGIKDIFIDENTLYVSYIESNNKGGYNTSIIKAEISDYLNFSSFFTPRNYIPSTIKEFSPIQSGGRIVNYKKDSLLLSIGDYRDRMSAQNINTDNGKIIAISKKNSGSRVISLGHRNPQGLDYSSDFDYVISTEHGPSGGDEVNLNIDTENIKNFGWPISSYGIHYSVVASNTDSHGGDANRVIKEAPLYKNHSDYGFTEPLIYWDINPAVSEVKFIEEKKDYNEFIVSSLGYDTIQRPYAQHLMHYKHDMKKSSTELIRKINVGERVRDITYNKSSGRIYYVGESTGVIGFINLRSE
ncbi:PQQ-dependent sugar dehydrogenase [Flavobacteriaceae bacterium]|nr:PQQ-dependent sugar dehydrogenase [Flavobacteriaceae bacterium]